VTRVPLRRAESCHVRGQLFRALSVGRPPILLLGVVDSGLHKLGRQESGLEERVRERELKRFILSAAESGGFRLIWSSGVCVRYRRILLLAALIETGHSPGLFARFLCADTWQLAPMTAPLERLVCGRRVARTWSVVTLSGAGIVLVTSQ
jgi:hypothetical protein